MEVWIRTMRTYGGKLKSAWQVRKCFLAEVASELKHEGSIELFQYNLGPPSSIKH